MRNLEYKNFRILEILEWKFKKRYSIQFIQFRMILEAQNQTLNAIPGHNSRKRLKY